MRDAEGEPVPDEITGARRLDWAEWERPQPHGGGDTNKWFECVRLDTVAGRAYLLQEQLIKIAPPPEEDEEAADVMEEDAPPPVFMAVPWVQRGRPA